MEHSEHRGMQNELKSSQRFGVLKRRFQRTGVHGFVADIADGNSMLNGLVADVSSGGFRMTRIADTFVVAKHSYTAFISGGGKNYKVLVKPCWQKNDAGSNFVEMGFKIVDAPWEWMEFVLNTVSDTDYEDDWGFHA